MCSIHVFLFAEIVEGETPGRLGGTEKVFANRVSTKQASIPNVCRNNASSKHCSGQLFKETSLELTFRSIGFGHVVTAGRPDDFIDIVGARVAEALFARWTCILRKFGDPFY